jgi:hypothetical protein
VAPDRGAASSGAGLQLQGYLSDDNMTGVDGAEVQVGLLGPLGNLLWNASVLTADGHFSAFVPMPTGLADGSYSVYAGYGALRAYSAISLDSAPPSLSDVSAVPLGNGTILIQAYALDNILAASDISCSSRLCASLKRQNNLLKESWQRLEDASGSAFPLTLSQGGTASFMIIYRKNVIYGH